MTESMPTFRMNQSAISTGSSRYDRISKEYFFAIEARCRVYVGSPVCLKFWTTLVVGILAFVLLIPKTAQAEKRAAFLVGNSNYEHAPSLKNPTADVELLAETLRSLSFDVAEHHNLTRAQLAARLSTFLLEHENADITLFYFAGHGMQLDGKNYLVGTEAELSSVLNVDSEALELGKIVSTLEQHTRAALVFVDACRDNPIARNFYSRNFSGTRAINARGLARVSGRHEGSMIAFSASPGELALDGEGANSPFASALAQHLPTENVEILSLMKRVIRDVGQVTANQQKPTFTNDMSEEVYLATRTTSSDVPHQINAEQTLFEVARSENTVSAWNLFLRRYPDGEFREAAAKERNTLVAAILPQLDSGEARKAPAIAKRSVVSRQSFKAHSRQEMRRIQRALNASHASTISVDGLLGTETRAALQQFQGFIGDVQSGSVTKNTLFHLGLEYMQPGIPFEPFYSGAPQVLKLETIKELESDPRIHDLVAALADYKMNYGFSGGRVYAVVRAEPGAASDVISRANGIGAVPADINDVVENWFLYGMVRNFPELWTVDAATGTARGPHFGYPTDSGFSVSSTWIETPSASDNLARYVVRLDPTRVGPIGNRPTWGQSDAPPDGVILELE